MDPIMVIGLIVTLLLFLIFFGVPVAFALGIAGIMGIIIIEDVSSLLYIMGSYPVSRVCIFSFTVLPMFVLMGQLSYASGLAPDAYDLANKWLGRLRGGLVLVTIGACGMIAATTGSGSTGTVAMGRIAVPEMRKYGYDIKLSTASAAAGGTVGALIPPSTPLLIYGILTYHSIGKLFIAGILPGILSVLIYMVMVNVRCTLNPQLAKRGEKFTWREKFSSLPKAWGVILIFVVVMGGLYLGVVTPTQVGALGSFIALVLVLIAIARGKSDWGMLREAAAESVKLCGMIFAFIVGAGIFSIFITLTGVLPHLVESVANFPLPRIAVLLVVMAFYIPIGMFFDPMSIILVTVPVVYPIVVDGLGYDGIFFAILLVKMIELAAITPPVGFGLYVLKGLFPDVSIGEIISGCIWFMLMDLTTLIILVAFPSIILWLPSLMQ